MAAPDSVVADEVGEDMVLVVRVEEEVISAGQPNVQVRALERPEDAEDIR